MLILIPAYEPDLRLVQLVHALHTQAPGAAVLVVDDGSGPAFDGVFDVAARAGAEVVRHHPNRGKGAALKEGFARAAVGHPGEDIVCADCDGQHTPGDILRVAAAIRPGTTVLGVRRFTGVVPARSRIGNTVTPMLFTLVSGQRVVDTQTGLRGYPPDLLNWLGSVEGERFEYEFNLLLGSRDAGVALEQVEIATVYVDENTTSHFRPVRDSLRIYLPMLTFAASSLTAFVVDAVALLMLVRLGAGLAFSVVGARMISASCNFLLNRTVVFRSTGSPGREAVRYAALATGILAANLALLELTVVMWGWNLLAAKVAVEAALLLLSYIVQHRAVFVEGRARQCQEAGPHGVPPPRVVQRGSVT